MNTTSRSAANSSAHRIGHERAASGGRSPSRALSPSACREAHGGIGGPTEADARDGGDRARARARALSEHGRAVRARCLRSVARAAQQAEIFERSRSGRTASSRWRICEPDARYALDLVETTARRCRRRLRARMARSSTVLDGAVADRFLVSARLAARRSRCRLPDRAAHRGSSSAPRYRTQDGRSAADLKLRDVKVAAREPARRRIGRAARASSAPSSTASPRCAPKPSGAMEAINRATLEYTKSRKQFGQPIATVSGPAAPHGRHVRLRDAGALHEPARHRPLRHGDAALRRHDISAAKAFIGKAARFVGQQAVQLHGGMGMADELAVSHYFKRLTMINADLRRRGPPRARPSANRSSRKPSLRKATPMSVKRTVRSHRPHRARHRRLARSRASRWRERSAKWARRSSSLRARPAELDEALVSLRATRRGSARASSAICRDAEEVNALGRCRGSRRPARPSTSSSTTPAQPGARPPRTIRSRLERRCWTSISRALSC